MVLHIGVDFSDNQENQKIIHRLTEFFKNKKYKTTFRETITDEYIENIFNHIDLKSHEILLLRAFNRSINYYGENWEDYDLVFWNGTEIDDYRKLNPHISEHYLNQVNKFFPRLNLYITVIKSLNEEIKINPYLNHSYILYDEENIIEDIIKTVFDNLPRCNWCGKIFTKTKKNKKYCSPQCKKYALEEQYRENNRNYYHKYKNVMSERSKGQLGSRGANLHGTADLNPLRELQKVRNAKKALGLKPIK